MLIFFVRWSKGKCADGCFIRPYDCLNKLLSKNNNSDGYSTFSDGYFICAGAYCIKQDDYSNKQEGCFNGPDGYSIKQEGCLNKLLSKNNNPDGYSTFSDGYFICAGAYCIKQDDYTTTFCLCKNQSSRKSVCNVLMFIFSFCSLLVCLRCPKDFIIFF
jgi:hypothetical protein